MAENQKLAPQKIGVLRPLQLGDLLCAVPALRALRLAFPQSKITLIGLPWASSFVERFHQYLDQLIIFPGFPGFPEQTPQIEDFPIFLTEIQSEKFDLALQMHGSGSMSNSIISLFGAKKVAGFYLEGLYCPDEVTFIRYPVEEPEIRRHLRLLEHLDIPLQGEDLEFPLYDRDWREFARIRDEFRLVDGQYVLIHPGARANERRWAPEKFAAVADRLADYGYQIILTGTQEESQIVQTVQNEMTSKAINLCGLTSLGTLGVLVASARLLVSNDTGISHIAAALQTPSVILFTNSEPDRWGPLNQELHRRVLWATGAPPATVLFEAEQLLQADKTYARE